MLKKKIINLQKFYKKVTQVISFLWKCEEFMKTYKNFEE